MAARKSIPYIVLCSLVYAHAEEYERAENLVVVDVGHMCSDIRIRPEALHESLSWLKDCLLIEDFTWHSTYANVRINPPVGYEFSSAVLEIS